ncbi:MAG: hypothetical protein IPF59_03190 [Ignavibacteria bacterium]|nr:hypothetical protein [Ignavibacteria bacterium]
MNRISIVALLCLGLACSIGIQARDARTLITAGQKLAAKRSEMIQGTMVNVDRELMNSVAVNRDAELTVTLPVDGTNETVTLHRHDVLPLTSPVVIVTARGPERFSTRNIAVYRGSLPGQPLSLISLVVTPTTITGVIDAKGRRTLIGPSRTTKGEFVAATIDSRDATSKDFCHTADLDVPSHVLNAMNESIGKSMERVQANDTLVVEVAVEADYQVFTGMNSSVETATAYIAQLFSVASQVYERDLQTKLVLSYVRVWSVANDPYSDQAMVFSLIDPFKAYYRANMDTVKRDIAVLLTMRGPSGGIAGSIGGLCTPSGSFAVCDLDGQVQQLPTYSWDAMVVTHEIGHVCGGLHTQSCLWPGGPLDSCIASEDGQCVPWEETHPAVGTIMSYCHQTGTPTLFFHPRHKVVLRSNIEASSCVGARSVPMTNVLRGRLLHATTRQPISGVTLEIAGSNEDMMMRQPEPVGNRTSITDADGRFQFDGLGNGLMDVIIPGNYMVVPSSWLTLVNAYHISISEPLTEVEVLVSNAQSVTFDLDVDSTTTALKFILVNEDLPGFYVSLDLPKFVIDRLPLTQSLPPGQYTLLPFAIGRKFEPEQLTFTIHADRPADTVRMKVTKPSTSSALMQVAALSLFEDEQGIRSLSPNEPGRLLDYNSRALVNNVTSGPGSAFYKAGLSASKYFTIVPDLDTTQFVQASADPFLYSNPMMDGVVKRSRTFPLVARPYTFSSFASTWTPIAGGTVISDSGSSLFERIAVPIPFEFGGTTIDSLWVSPTGKVSAGISAFYDVEVNSTPRSDMILCPLSSWAYPRNDSIQGAVLVETRGTAPERTFVIEWRNLGQELYDTAMYYDGVMSFQLHLHETTGTIDFVYGPMEVPKDSPMEANIGIRGKDNLDFHRVQFTVGGVQGWSKVNTRTSAPLAAFALSAERKPEPGQTYRFSKPTTSVEEADHQGPLLVTPNPAADVVSVQWPVDLRVSTISVVDILGAIVAQIDVTSGATSARVDVTTLAAGSYWIIARGQATFTAPFTVTR